MARSEIVDIGKTAKSRNDDFIHLYSKNNTTDFTSNGIAILEPTECKLDTSKWEWTMTLPKDDWGKWKRIEPLCVIKAPCYTDDSQLWRVKTIEETDYEIHVTGTPIFFDINWVSPYPINVYNQGKYAFDEYRQLVSSSPFLFESDSTTYGIWNNTQENGWIGTSFLTAINGMGEASFTRVYGGLVMYDNYRIRVLKTASQKDLIYKFGSNLPAGVVKETIDVSDLCTRIIAGGKDANDDRWLYVTQNTGTQNERVKFITSSHINDYPAYIKPVKIFQYEDIKYKGYDDGQTTEGEVYTDITSFFNALETKAAKEFTENHIDEPRIKVEVDLQIMDQGEYITRDISKSSETEWDLSNVLPFRKAALGDAVTIQHDGMGISITGRITNLVYNALTRSVEKVTISNDRVTYTNESLYTLLGGD